MARIRSLSDILANPPWKQREKQRPKRLTDKEYRKRRFEKFLKAVGGGKTKTSARYQMAIRTQKEVAEILGTTPQTVQRAELSAFSKIRMILKALGE